LALLFVLQHAAALVLLLVVAAAAGTAVAGARVSLALRAALGLAVAGQVFVILGTFGALRPWSIAAFVAAAIVAGAMRMERHAISWATMLVAAPFFILALDPPVAFDETLYHLPFVRAIAASGALNFQAALRFPIFPQLHEALCAAMLLAFDDVATHLVATAEVLMMAGIVMRWPRQRSAGILAAALCLGHPIVLQLGSVTYVDAALALFTTAGFYCLDRATSERSFAIDAAQDESRNFAAAGFFFGTACSVKYLGLYFAGGAFVFALCFGRDRRRSIPLFAAACAAAMLPMYGRILALTGNPVFPYASRLFGASPWAFTLPERMSLGTRIAGALRVIWDVTFARERMGLQPPYSPLLLVAVLIALIAATRNRRAAFLCAMAAGYIAAFTWLPQDSRYLLPLLPLVSVTAAMCVAPRLPARVLNAITVIAISPLFLYAGYRVVRDGPPPVTPAQRRAFVERRIPEYRALEHRAPGRVYVCGAEQLKDFAGDELLGEAIGPLSSDVVLGNTRDAAQLSEALARLDARSFLVSRRACRADWQRLPAPPYFARVYADESAELWQRR
jgi:hypothetical protein